jgi:hypothetical protein
MGRSVTPSHAKDWWALQTSTPSSDSAADRKTRKKMFGAMDANGNGLLSMTEIERLLKKTMGANTLGVVCLLRPRCTR